MKLALFISGEGRMSKVEGFKAGLKSLGLNKVEYVLFNGENSLKGVEERAIEIAGREEEFDLIAVGGSLEAYYLKKVKPNLKAPIVIMGGTAIKTWGFTNDFQKPDKNITGVDNLNTELMEKRVEFMKRFFPDIKKAVVFCTPQFEASKVATRLTREAGLKYGINVVPVSVRDVQDLEYVMSHMKEDGFSAVIITPCFYTENFLTSYILHYANFYGIVVVCLSPEQAMKGCAIAYGSSGYDQGYQSAYLAYKILMGERVENVPFQRVSKIKLVVNQRTIRELGYELKEQAIALADQVAR